jgi:hypothetical protein
MLFTAKATLAGYKAVLARAMEKGSHALYERATFVRLADKHRLV